MSLAKLRTYNSQLNDIIKQRDLQNPQIKNLIKSLKVICF